MAAILFGSISTVADTSELQRQAFNEAFAAHGLDWNWSREEYLPLLERSGGKDRIAEYAAARGEQVDAEAVHATKSELFQKRLAESELTPREGVAETIRGARDAGYKVALVTTTAQANVASLLEAVDDLAAGDFDLVLDGSSVDRPKPDRAAYAFALDRLGEESGDCVAIEDNLPGVEAAVTAGVRCVAFPNENTAGHDFDRADQRVDQLDFAQLRALVDGR